MAEIIAAGTTNTSSADFTLADGQSTTLSVKDANGNLPSGELGGNLFIQIKSGTGYASFGELTFKDPVKVLAAPGTFRTLRQNPILSYGVDRN